MLGGPSGVGKSTLARTLAESLQLPHTIVDVSELAETNWSGLQLADVLTGLYHQSGASMRRMARAVIVLDELDKLAARGASTAGRDYLRGKQRSLLGLLGGGVPLHFGAGGDRDRSFEWPSDSALIIGAGVFQGLPDGRDPAPEDLIRLGLMPELVERLGQVIRLQPLGPAELARVLERQLAPMRASYEHFGFELRISPAAVAAVARTTVHGLGRAAGPRTAGTWLIEAAQRGLISLLNADAQPGTTWTLTPDDVADRLVLPSPPRRR